jgi:hypothetical protein
MPNSRRRSTASGRRSSRRSGGRCCDRLGLQSLGAEQDGDAGAGGVQRSCTRRRCRSSSSSSTGAAVTAGGRCAARRRALSRGGFRDAGRVDHGASAARCQSRPSVFRAGDAAHHADRRDGGAVGADRRARRLVGRSTRRSARSRRCGRPIRAAERERSRLRRAAKSLGAAGELVVERPRPGSTLGQRQHTRRWRRWHRGHRAAPPAPRWVASQQLEGSRFRQWSRRRRERGCTTLGLALERDGAGLEEGEIRRGGAGVGSDDDVVAHSLQAPSTRLATFTVSPSAE